MRIQFFNYINVNVLVQISSIFKHVGNKFLKIFYLAQLLQPPKNGMSTLFPVFGLPSLRGGGCGLHNKKN